MERDLAGVTISADGFSRLAEACQHDVRFPRTFTEWCALVESGDQKLLAQDSRLVVIPLDVEDFVAWCQRVDIAPSLDGLRAYLILIRRREHVPGKSPTGPRTKPRALQRRGPPKMESSPGVLRDAGTGRFTCSPHLF